MDACTDSPKTECDQHCSNGGTVTRTDEHKKIQRVLKYLV